MSDTKKIMECVPNFSEGQRPEVIEAIDEKISANAESWSISRLSKVSLAIMRIAVYEMLFIDAIPMNVSINESVELAKKFDEEKSPKFINGVLNAIGKAAEKDN